LLREVQTIGHLESRGQHIEGSG
jgi:hypothetical protein